VRERLVQLVQFRNNPWFNYYTKFALRHESDTSLAKSEEPYGESANFGAVLNRERARGEANAALAFQRICDSDLASLQQQIKQQEENTNERS
jgi:hypothetical protein